MKWIAFLIAFALLLSSCALGQYTTGAPGGAPTPTAPSSAEALGLQAPSAGTSLPAPSSQERSQGLIKADQQSAYAAAPQATRLEATSPTYTQVIVPSGGFAPNSLYVSYAPQTVAACNLYANLLLWMQTSRSGNIWFYEWYPNGMLNTKYAGYVYYPGWYKRWFPADVPGWHILQYYCSGWSNYVYIYVYGPGGYWVNPIPNPQPTYPYPYGSVYGPGYSYTFYSSFSSGTGMRPHSGQFSVSYSIGKGKKK